MRHSDKLTNEVKRAHDALNEIPRVMARFTVSDRDFLRAIMRTSMKTGKWAYEMEQIQRVIDGLPDNGYTKAKELVANFCAIMITSSPGIAEKLSCLVAIFHRRAWRAFARRGAFARFFLRRYYRRKILTRIMHRAARMERKASWFAAMTKAVVVERSR